MPRRWSRCRREETLPLTLILLRLLIAPVKKESTSNKRPLIGVRVSWLTSELPSPTTGKRCHQTDEVLDFQLQRKRAASP